MAGKEAHLLTKSSNSDAGLQPLLLMRHPQTSVLTQNCQQQLLVAGLVAPAPNGVIPAWSYAVKGVVETSTNLALVKTEGATLRLRGASFVRSAHR